MISERSFSAPNLNVWRQPQPGFNNSSTFNLPVTSQDNYRSRLFSCQEKIKNKLIIDSLQSEECKESCRKLLMEISKPQANVSIEILDEIESALSNQAELTHSKIADMNCK